MSRPVSAVAPSYSLKEIPIKNAGFENVPGPNTAPTNQPGYWINGQAGGSTTESRYGWFMQSGGVGGTIGFDTTNKHDGSSCLQLYVLTLTFTDIVAQNYPGAANLRTYAPQLEAGATYRMTYWMKTKYLGGNNTVGNGAGVQACVRDQTGSLKVAASSPAVGGVAAYVVTDTEWTQYSVDFTVPAYNTDTASGGYAAGYFFTPKLCIFNRTGGNQGTTNDLQMRAWFDDIRLYKVS